jgi:phage tail-like protein
MRDVNQSGFLLIADRADFTGFADTEWDAACRRLILRPVQSWMLPRRDVAAARAERAASVPLVRDSAGRIGRLNADRRGVEVAVSGAWEPVLDMAGNPLTAGTGTFIAMSLGAGGRLALLAADGGNVRLELFDLRGRWPLDSPGNRAIPVDADPAATDVAVAPDGTLLVGGRGALLVFAGGPIETMFERPVDQFQPVDPNPHELTLRDRLPLPSGNVVAVAADAGRRLVLLEEADGSQSLSTFDEASGQRSDTPISPQMPVFNDAACLDQGRVALLAAAETGDTAFVRRDCAVATLAGGFALVGERYPRIIPGPARFADSADGTVYYAAADRPRPLLPLPHPGYATAGIALRSGLPSRDPDAIWHRAYCEADLPQGTTLTLWARAAEEPLVLAQDPPELVARLLDCLCQTPGAIFDAAMLTIGSLAPGFAAPLGQMRQRLALAPLHRQPPLVPSGVASEIPFHPGLAALEGGLGTLYEVLLQRARGKSRRLQGGLLDIAFVLTGDGRHTPTLRACRVYCPRFSYQEQYLPRLFQQTSAVNEADTAPAAAPPDFRERLLANLEGILTPIEGRVAAAERLLDPMAAPPQTLPWLASFLGRELDLAWPEKRQRRSIAVAGDLLRQRGTYPGVCLALDVATDGGVQCGEVVVVENYRLRRTMATILGIDMDDVDNPLTVNARVSGNSIVGDTLILSSAAGRAFLSLFAPDLASAGETAQVERFFDTYADRVTILLHGAARRQRTAVERVLRAEMPAHVQWDVFETERSFVLGLSPLLGVDTFLDPAPPPTPVTLGESTIGRDAVIRDPGTLAPQDPGGASFPL